ncbi:unnamed protein product [Caenorhabditis auriculariae]|uniref:Uncharacterized protein n=1 Tax=Caenorhabditis auriculariae TaxID=2777116 RepID=A0A8S1HL12_9PELO|nr:unnamed protein product [Caenorhabditis auriculariae]
MVDSGKMDLFSTFASLFDADKLQQAAPQLFERVNQILNDEEVVRKKDQRYHNGMWAREGYKPGRKQRTSKTKTNEERRSQNRQNTNNCNRKTKEEIEKIKNFNRQLEEKFDYYKDLANFYEGNKMIIDSIMTYSPGKTVKSLEFSHGIPNGKEIIECEKTIYCEEEKKREDGRTKKENSSNNNIIFRERRKLQCFSLYAENSNLRKELRNFSISWRVFKEVETYLNQYITSYSPYSQYQEEIFEPIPNHFGF